MSARLFARRATTAILLLVSTSALAAEGVSMQVLVSATVIGFLFGLLAATIVSTLRSRNLLRQAVSTDPLTRLHNRAAILEVATSRFAEARESGEPLSLIVLELDHFHDINDQHGHQAGDEVLQLAALSAKRVLRGEDIIGRIGSAEFMIVLPGARDRAARHVAERLRQKVQNQPLLLDELPLQVTISLGVAEICAGDEQVDGLVSRAEAALEDAKKNGANKVRIAKPLRPVASES